MIKLKRLPENPGQFGKLLEFANEILQICQALDIEPLLSGSLAVLAYTEDDSIQVNDIDLSCMENDFPRISEHLQALGIDYQVKAWHVLQARRGDLKVEFDSLEYWMNDIPDEYEVLDTGVFQLKMVCLDYLKLLYQRGVGDTAQKESAIDQKKHDAILRKWEILHRGSMNTSHD